ncbi:MAG: hypothetical protein HRT89_21140 [Lentisphaeria bacterium]|nr:hypothetical protein [Lentisphaeria bacterium]NQZ70566.1 hypothetical protein [Lentisphaeria bacterium]
MKATDYGRLNEVYIEMIEAIFEIDFEDAQLVQQCDRPNFEERFVIIMNFTNNHTQEQIVMECRMISTIGVLKHSS